MHTEEPHRDTNIIHDDYSDVMHVLRNRANEISAEERDLLAHAAGMYAANEVISNDLLLTVICVVNRIIYPRGA